MTNKNLKLIFAGTPDFSATILQALLDAQYHIAAVYTQPDRPAGRGRKLTPSAVKQLAETCHIPIYQPTTLRDEQEQKKLADLQADLMIVVAYGLLLPLPVLKAPRWGCINVHASLLPRWRGAAPIQRAILSGDDITGVTIMQMDEGLDTGPMLYKAECAISPTETSETLYHKLAPFGAQALLHTLEHLSEIKPVLQDSSQATYAHKIKKEEARLDWNLPAHHLAQMIRGFNPWPVAYIGEGAEAIRVWQAAATREQVQAQPGTIIRATTQSIDVATPQGVLQLQMMQLPGGKILSVADILNARKDEFAVGKQLQ